MGLVVVLLLAAAAFAVLLRYARLPRLGITLSATALLFGMTGYVFQSHPGLPGTPVAEREARGVPEDAAAIATRREMSGQFGSAAQVTDFADTLDRLGYTQVAIIAVKTELRRHPDNPELWVALGNAIVAHGGGLISPAAEYAFDYAAALSPTHPAPPFFKALALAKSGRLQQGADILRTLLKRAPRDVQWRTDVEARLRRIANLRYDGGMTSSEPPLTTKKAASLSTDGLHNSLTRAKTHNHHMMAAARWMLPRKLAASLS